MHAASTLEAEVATPVQNPNMPSDKVFTKQDFDNLLKGYRSLVDEHDYWISDDMVEGAHAPCTPRHGGGCACTCACMPHHAIYRRCTLIGWPLLCGDGMPLPRAVLDMQMCNIQATISLHVS